MAYAAPRTFLYVHNVWEAIAEVEDIVALINPEELKSKLSQASRANHREQVDGFFQVVTHCQRRMCQTSQPTEFQTESRVSQERESDW